MDLFSDLQKYGDMDVVDIEWIKRGLLKKGKTQSGLAHALGRAPSAITALLKGERQLKANEIRTIADYLEEPIPQLGLGNVVRVMGYIGAGAEIQPDFEQVPSEGLFEIEVPFPVADDAIAFEVQGDSMWPRYDAGDVVVCWRFSDSIADVIGWEAAVRTVDGRRYLKRVIKGSSPNTFDLESYNAAPIRGVRLDWAGKVSAVVRAQDWRRLGSGSKVVKNARRSLKS
ncbi:MAG: S24 family peptidase [Alsobacter sp.]